MNFKLLIVLFLGLLAILLLLFTLPFTLHLKIIALSVVALGIIALLLARRAEESIRKDLLRDIGIAFIVAVVVTVVYEYSTRSLEKQTERLRMLDDLMGQFIPDSVWKEVKEDVLKQQRIRRNVDIEFKILRNARLSNGKYITAPAGQVFLWMKYGYDLYATAAGGRNVPIQHELAYEMWNKELEIPRFESVSVIRDYGRQVDMYEGEKLKRIYDGKSIVLGPDIVQLPAPQLNQPVRIVSERYELMCAPGSYNLVIPELTARVDGSTNPTIKVSVKELPSDLDVRLNTYYEPHAFTPAGSSDNVWVYNSIALPGQSFTLILQPKPRASVGAFVNQ